MSNSKRYRYEEAERLQLMEGMRIGALVRVLTFDPALMTVDVQPLSQRLSQGDYHAQPPILSVPVAFQGGGGFVLRPWFQTGDLGVVLYLDHDIDKIMLSGEESAPNTDRMHSSSDAVFVGAVLPWNAPLPGLPEQAVVLGTRDGSTYIALSGLPSRGRCRSKAALLYLRMSRRTGSV